MALRGASRDILRKLSGLVRPLYYSDFERRRRDIKANVRYSDLTEAAIDLLTKADPDELELLEFAIATLRDINIRLAKMSGMEL